MQQSDTNYDERPSRIPWPPIVFVAVLAAAIALDWVQPIPWPGLDDWPARAVGLGFGITGIALLAYAIITLRQHDTTYLPDVGATTLVTSGPFRRFRNPIYLADCFILLGLAELTKNVWFVAAAFAFAGLVTWLAILPEERHLERRFGDAYRAYKENSRRWL